MAKAKKLLKTAKERAAAIKDAKILARMKQKKKDKVRKGQFFITLPS